jgi:hypothetical protein
MMSQFGNYKSAITWKDILFGEKHKVMGTRLTRQEIEKEQQRAEAIRLKKLKNREKSVFVPKKNKDGKDNENT